MPLRRATAGDNARLLELFGAVPMQGELVLTTQRSPDYFALFQMQRGTTEVWVHEAAGQLDGMGTLHLREGWLDGASTSSPYIWMRRIRWLRR